MKKSRLLGAVCALASILISTTAISAPVVINPLSGLSGSFSFGGTGDIGTLQTDPVDGWEITVASSSLIDIRVDDCCTIGDEFSLVVDGAVVPWDISNPGAGVLFFGENNDLSLSPGTHTFDFMLTAACCSGGAGSFSFSAVSVDPAAVVPVPAAVWLFGSGLLGLVGIARRKKAA